MPDAERTGGSTVHLAQHTLSRRAFLRGLSVAVVAGPVLAACDVPGGAAQAAQAPAAAGSGLLLRIVNESGASDTVRVYIVGTNLETGEQSHVGSDGVLTPVATSDNTDDGFTDYGIVLDAGSFDLSLPVGMSGRIYVALDDKLRFKAVDSDNGAALQYPAGWNATDPNAGVLHDWVEFTYTVDGMFCNTTMVDQFGVPLSINLTGTQDQTTGTLVDGGREAVFDAIAAYDDFADLIIGDRLRVIAPGHGIDAGRFSDVYYEPYIDEVWSHYQSTGLRVTTNAGTFTGRVDAGADVLRFDQGVADIARPSTRDVFFCDGALAAPNDGVTGPVAAVLGAAFNRSTLLAAADQPTTDPAAFYQTAVTNHYAAAMHAATVDGKAYGFAFDDVVDAASFIQDAAPTSCTVTLTPW